MKNCPDFEILMAEAEDILTSKVMQKEKQLPHHGKTSCYDHSVQVAMTSLQIARSLHRPVDTKSLVRGALLHDLYLYDWHIATSHDKLHGFAHARIALENAERHFTLNDIERDIIIKHMFPLNLPLPRYRETMIVTLADKICTAKDMARGTRNLIRRLLPTA